MENLKEAIEYLVELGREEELTVEFNGDAYLKKGALEKVYPEYPLSLQASTLTAIVDYIKNNPDGRENLIIKIDSHATVSIVGLLDSYERREKLLTSTALIPEVMRYGYYYGGEEFNIALMARFVQTPDIDKLLKIAGNIQESAVKTSTDDGVSQSVTMKTGITSVGNVEVPKKVRLKPFRTFTEIPQPESEFVFRIQEGPSMALFEADGGAWKNQAILSIKKYLEEELKDLENIIILA